MKKSLGIIFIILTVIVLLFIAWIKLPFTITRYSDIRNGEEIIQNIQTYKVKNGLPNQDNWEVLKKLGFINKVDRLQPYYNNLKNETFEIVYLDASDGPYLMWNSNEKVWKLGYPSIIYN